MPDLTREEVERRLEETAYDLGHPESWADMHMDACQCSRCGRWLQIVRPGKWQCECDGEPDEKYREREALQTALSLYARAEAAEQELDEWKLKALSARTGTPCASPESTRTKRTDMTVEDIVRDYLTANGYDGLAYCEGWDGCGCGLDDLICCKESCYKCQPARRVTWDTCKWRVEEDGCPEGYNRATCPGCYTIEEGGGAQ